ncbi:MAG TPA: hypothetical protein GX731_07485, partial [Clostridiales bacterium]|nr:hypothetical protein [Clostridiales bacterium]
MMNKNIESDKYIWDEFTSSWKGASRALGSWELAAKELRKASDLLRRHNDVNNIYVGNIVSSISKLKGDVDDFIYLTKNIHAELEYEVDRPFYKNIMECVSDAYGINPGKFSLDKTRADGSVECIVLTELLAATICDVDLRESFNKMVDELEEDVPSDTIKGMIIESIGEYYGDEYDEFMTANVPPVDPSKVTAKELALNLAKAKEYQASRKIFIEYYEMLNPEKSRKLDRLLKNMSKDKNPRYQGDIANLKYIAYMAEEPYQTLFFESLDDMKIKDYDYTYTDKDGKVQSSQFWSPLGNTLTLNFDHAHKYGLVDPRGPYTVFFHETGHGVDDLSRPEAKRFLWKTWEDKHLVEEYRNENNQTLNDVMIEDVRAHLTVEIEHAAKAKGVSLKGNQVAKILDNMMAVNSSAEIQNSNGKV